MVICAYFAMVAGAENAQSQTAQPTQSLQNSPPTVAGDVAQIPDGTVITKEVAKAIAKDAYVWGWPIVNAFHRRDSFATAPEPGLRGGILPVAPVGYVSMLSDYIAWDERWVAHPNQDVVYGFGFGATDKDPVVLQVPDFGDRFWVYSIYDARSDEFSNLGRQYGTKPGNYLIVGPNWKGQVPDGITAVIKAPTELVAMGPRIFMDDSKEDREAIQSILNQVVIYPLSKYTGEKKTTDWRKTPHFPVSGASSKAEISWVNPEMFFDELPAILEQVPPLPGEESRYATLKALFSAAKSDPAIKNAIKQAAIESEMELIKPLFNFPTNGRKYAGGWNSPPNGAAWGYDYITRTATAKSNMYVNQPTETRYFFVEVDGDGKRLNGKNTYTVTFPKDQTPPVNGFWSLTMYDPEHFFAKNDRKRYSVGTKNLKNMTFNKDGSLTIYVQNKSPGQDKEANWLPAPATDFEMTIRTYWPKPEVNNGEWTPPAVARASSH
jgi:hypothetical protein